MVERTFAIAPDRGATVKTETVPPTKISSLEDRRLLLEEAGEIPAADYSVNLIYLRPKDQAPVAALENAFQNTMFEDIRRWFAQQLGGKTFKNGSFTSLESTLASRDFENHVYHTAVSDIQDNLGIRLYADSVSGEDQQRVTAKGSIYVIMVQTNQVSCDLGTIYDGSDTHHPGGIVAESDENPWHLALSTFVFNENDAPWTDTQGPFADWRTKPNWQYPSATGIPGCPLPNDQRPTPATQFTQEQIDQAYWQSHGVMAHELGHALGLNHPDGQSDFDQRLMGTGWIYFPFSTLSDDEKTSLLNGPYMTEDFTPTGTSSA